MKTQKLNIFVVGMAFLQVTSFVFADGPWTCNGSWSVSSPNVTSNTGTVVNENVSQVNIKWNDGTVYSGTNGSVFVNSYTFGGPTYEQAITEINTSLPTQVSLLGLNRKRNSDGTVTFSSNNPFVDIIVGTYGAPGYRHERANGTGTVTLICKGDSPKTYRGVLATPSCTRAGGLISGWAEDTERPTEPIVVALYLDGQSYWSYALLASEPNHNNHGFSVPVPAPLLDGQPHTVNAQFADTSTNLAQSPQQFICQ